MEAIVAIDENWGIGYKNDLLFKHPKDLQRFKKMTLGQVVIMGRKTLESLPDKKPLPGRVNIVLTRDSNYSCPDVLTVPDKAALFGLLKFYPTKIHYVVGGGEIYNLLIDHCTDVHITQFCCTFENVDTYFPKINKLPEWELVEDMTWLLDEFTPAKFMTYTKSFYGVNNE